MTLKPAGRRSSVGTLNTVPPVGSGGTLIILVITGTARSARPSLPRSSGGGPQRELLPVPYFHLVFTVPHALTPHPRAQETAVDTAIQRGESDARAVWTRNLGGQIGCTMVLHIPGIRPWERISMFTASWRLGRWR